MRRWNGWGEETTVVELPDNGRGFLAELVGPGLTLPDATLEQVLAKVPASRLPEHPLVVREAATACCTPEARACRTGWRCAKASSVCSPMAWPTRRLPSRSASC